MKYLLLALLLLAGLPRLVAQTPAPATGRVVTTYLDSRLLRGNAGGENPRRRVSVYLPPTYEANPAKRYPVLYYLHGFGWNDSLIFHADGMARLLDQAIAAGQIRPLIVVVPNESTLYLGSFYANSSTNGPWADFTARELVSFIDRQYRTLARPGSRGLAGHSMGGNGVLRLALSYPGTYAAAYALSPGLVAPHAEWMADRPSQAVAARATSRAEVLRDFNAVRLLSVARAFSPAPAQKPFGATLLHYPTPDSLARRDAALAQWAAATPLGLLPAHLSSLRQLRGLAFDWGAQDQLRHIPVTCRQMSTALTAFGVAHTAEEYQGDHGNRVMGPEGRVYQKLLPFFNQRLDFE